MSEKNSNNTFMFIIYTQVVLKRLGKKKKQSNSLVARRGVTLTKTIGILFANKLLAISCKPIESRWHRALHSPLHSTEPNRLIISISISRILSITFFRFLEQRSALMRRCFQSLRRRMSCTCALSHTAIQPLIKAANIFDD